MIENTASSAFSCVRTSSSFVLSGISGNINALASRVTTFAIGLFENTAFLASNSCRSLREMGNIAAALGILIALSSDEIGNVVEQSQFLLTGEMSAISKLVVVAAVARVPSGQRINVLRDASQLITPNMDGFLRAMIIRNSNQRSFLQGLALTRQFPKKIAKHVICLNKRLGKRN